MSLNIDNVRLIGASAVLVDSVDAGHTDENGVKAAIANSLVESKAGKFGDTPIKVYLNGQTPEITFNLIQTADNWGRLEEVLPGATYVTDGATKHKLTFGQVAGKELTAVALKFTPFIAAHTPGLDLTIPVAVPVGDFEIVYAGASRQIWACKFKVLVNESGGADGNYLFSFGDASATQDATPPTCSQVVPNDDATAVAVDTNIVWTFAEELDGNTVDENSVLLMEDPVGTGEGSFIAGAVTLVNNGASTTITFNPDSNLTASTTAYTAVLTNRIKDKAGNAFAGKITNFTTVA